MLRLFWPPRSSAVVSGVGLVDRHPHRSCQGCPGEDDVMRRKPLEGHSLPPIGLVERKPRCLQNRQAHVAQRLVGSTPAPLGSKPRSPPDSNLRVRR
jgi:hypothetical protein